MILQLVQVQQLKDELENVLLALSLSFLKKKLISDFYLIW